MDSTGKLREYWHAGSRAKRSIVEIGQLEGLRRNELAVGYCYKKYLGEISGYLYALRRGGLFAIKIDFEGLLSRLQNRMAVLTVRQVPLDTCVH